MSGDNNDAEPPKSEGYTSSYLAYQRGLTPQEPPRKKRRLQGPGKGLLVLLLVAAGLYFYRDQVALFLERYLGREVLQAFGGAMGWKDEETGEIRPTGGVTTFSGGGSVTVLPDDGSDRYRVVVPPSSNP